MVDVLQSRITSDSIPKLAQLLNEHPTLQIEVSTPLTLNLNVWSRACTFKFLPSGSVVLCRRTCALRVYIPCGFDSPTMPVCVRRFLMLSVVPGARPCQLRSKA